MDKESIRPGMELVGQAMCRRDHLEKVEIYIHENDDYVYFVCFDFGQALGAKQIAQDWFDKKDAGKLGMALTVLENAPYMDMKEFNQRFERPLPFDE